MQKGQRRFSATSTVRCSDADRVSEFVDAFIHNDYARVVGAVAIICGDRCLAEDAVQEALARAWERRDVDSIDQLGAWVTTVARNEARSYLRRLRVRRRAEESVARERPDATTRSGTSFDSELRLDLERALLRLPRRQREVVALYYLLDLSTQDVAQAMGIKAGTAKALLFQARESLRRVVLRISQGEEV